MKNQKVDETKGTKLDKFIFGLMEYHLYDPRSVCKYHCAKIHFNWPSETYYRPKEETIKNYYNVSRPHTLVSQVGPLHVTLEHEDTLESRPSEK